MKKLKGIYFKNAGTFTAQSDTPFSEVARMRAVFEKAEELGIAKCKDFLACVHAWLEAVPDDVAQLQFEKTPTGRRVRPGDIVRIDNYEQVCTVIDYRKAHLYESGFGNKNYDTMPATALFVLYVTPNPALPKHHPVGCYTLNHVKVRAEDGSWVPCLGYAE